MHSLHRMCFNRPSGYDLKERPYIKGGSCSNCTKGLECRRKQCAKPELTTISTSTPTTRYHTTTSTKGPEEPNTTTWPMPSTTEYRTTTSTKGPEELNHTTTAVSSTPQYQTTTSTKRPQQLNTTPASTPFSTLTTMEVFTTTSDASTIWTPAVFYVAMLLLAHIVQSS
uniref:SCP domain-containing protein n=1 Tax=Mesocestoides corti TaxID=53468 RepID=A0A5K3FVH8_MESCO